MPINMNRVGETLIKSIQSYTYGLLPLPIKKKNSLTIWLYKISSNVVGSLKGGDCPNVVGLDVSDIYR